MSIERSSVVWLESRTDYSVHEVVEMSGLPPALIDELIACGALPVVGTLTSTHLEAEAVILARAARRLRDHFELDDQGLAVAVSLLRRVRVLEAALSDTRARGASRTD